MSSLTPWGAIIDGVAQIADDLVTTDEERLKLGLEARKIDAGIAIAQGATLVTRDKDFAGVANLKIENWT